MRRPSPPNLRRRATLVAAGLVVVPALGACTVLVKPGPDAAAKALAEAYAGGDISKVTFDGATSANVGAFLASAVGDLKDVARTVTVSAVTSANANDKSATATLAFAWTLPTGRAGSGSAATATGSPAPDPTATAGSGGVSTAVWSYTTTAVINRATDDTWHVAWNPASFVPNLTGNEKLTLATVAAQRADIVGANSTPLMTYRDTVQIGIDKTKVPAAQAAASAAALATLVGSDPTAYSASVTSAGSRAFVPVLTVRSDDPLASSEAGQVAAIPGAVGIPGKSVIGPSPNFARSLLGTVGTATAEVVAKSNGALKSGDVVGLSGLEQRYDTRLRGTNGLAVQAVGTDAAGKQTSRDLFAVPAVNGTPLVLTLDATAQNVAEAVLQGGPSDTPTSLVAIRPSTGEIVALANGPGSKGLPIGNTGQTAPGSTFKIVSGLALLRAGLTPDSVVNCSPTVTVGGRAFKNYDDYPAGKLGNIPLRTAFANSCNTAFISNQDKVAQTDLADAAAALGIGVDLDLGFPAYLGSVPTSATATEHAASMIGQAKILVSPMDMATVVASAVHGAVVRPRLVDGNPAVAGFPTPSKPLQPAEAQALQAMLGAVVSEGSGASLAPDGVTAAKTGTAEYGSATPPLTHAWMVAVRGDLAVAVYVETGVSGSRTAGPLLKGFLEAYGG